MTTTAKEHDEIMKDMRSFDEPMPSVGIFGYDVNAHCLVDVQKKEVLVKHTCEHPYIEFGDSTCGCGRVAWAVDKFVVFVGQWAKDIEPELTKLIEKEFALPYFEFLYDEHWDLGHGWSGDM